MTMNEINLHEIDQYVYNTLFDRYHFETWQILNHFIRGHRLTSVDGSAVIDSLLLPEGRFFVLLVDNTQDPLLEFMQYLNMSPLDVHNWLNQFLDSRGENVIQSSQDETPLVVFEPDDTKELDISLLQTDIQTDSDEELYDPDYPNDNPLDLPEP